jgi:monoamine oxidase
LKAQGPRISRRALVAGLGAGLLSGSLPGRAAGVKAPVDVLVIGAGLAGLNAALLLEELGLSVQVIESRDRIGGRLHSLYHLPGNPEVGGNSMASGYARTIDMANRLGLALVDYAPRMFGSAPPELVLGDRILSRPQWTDSPLNPFPDGFRDKMPWELVPARTFDTNPLGTATDWLRDDFQKLDVPLHDYFRERGLSDAEIRLGYDTAPYYGTSAWDVSALMYAFNERWTADQGKIGNALYAVKGGNQRLPEAMAGKLSREVRLGEEVLAIEQGSDRVQVTCRGGAVFEARRVVCSVPFSKVRDIAMRPALQGVQREAVRSLGYMRNTLIFLVPRRPFWESDNLSPGMWTDGRLGTVIAQRFGDDPEEVTGLVVNARGWAADRLDRLGPEAAQAFAVREIERLRPAARGALEPRGFHSWWLDPHNAGDWAIFAPGQVSGLLPDMARPHGQCALLRRAHGDYEPRHGGGHGIGRARGNGNRVSDFRDRDDPPTHEHGRSQS